MASTTAPGGDEEGDAPEVGVAEEERVAASGQGFGGPGARTRGRSGRGPGRGTPRRACSARRGRGRWPGGAAPARRARRGRRPARRPRWRPCRCGDHLRRGVRVEALVDEGPEAGDEGAAKGGHVEVEADRRRAGERRGRAPTRGRGGAAEIAAGARHHAGGRAAGEGEGEELRPRQGGDRRPAHHEGQRPHLEGGEEEGVADRPGGDLLGDEEGRGEGRRGDGGPVGRGRRRAWSSGPGRGPAAKAADARLHLAAWVDRPGKLRGRMSIRLRYPASPENARDHAQLAVDLAREEYDADSTSRRRASSSWIPASTRCARRGSTGKERRRRCSSSAATWARSWCASSAGRGWHRAVAAAGRVAVADGGGAPRRLGVGRDRQGVQAARARRRRVPARVLRDGGGRRPRRAVSARGPRGGGREPVAIPITGELDLIPSRRARSPPWSRSTCARAVSGGSSAAPRPRARRACSARRCAARSLAAEVVSFEDAPPQSGGWGATVVVVRGATTSSVF